jgi:hypothetical protein
MFAHNSNTTEFKNYEDYLGAICSLSRLFSESKIPYLYYRIAENIFCTAFNAENLSRADIAYDAKIGDLGIGLKTFTNKGKSNEKIAEFNSNSKELRSLKGEDLAIKLAELRNNRIDFANRTYGVKNAIYHCIARGERMLYIFDEQYNKINEANITVLKNNDKGVSFADGINQYSFNFSKTTLYKNFITPQKAYKIQINIIENPLDLILDIWNQKYRAKIFEEPGINSVILPLYSISESKIDNKKVALKSGLNQWNAGGRKRDFGEIYIPVPRIIHKLFPNFFPPRDKTFKLIVPTGEELMAKLCQENSKALMTNPNKALSDWLLRKVLKLQEGELLTYDRLKLLGIDSVRITKIADDKYRIDFAKIDSFEEFIAERDGDAIEQY